MAEPMTEEELRDLRARMGRVPLCHAQESDTTIERLLATVDSMVEESDGLYDALDLATREHDQRLRELASATGVAWEGKSHEEVVELVKALRPSK